MAEANKPAGPDLASVGVPTEEIESGRMVVGQVDGKPVVLVRTEHGLHAVGGKCTHYSGPLGEGLCVGDQIRCPWHHAVFDLNTGEAVGAPALNPILVYEIEERDGRVFVTGQREQPKSVLEPGAGPESVVIVGSGAAGAAAAEALRRYAYAGSIVLIGEEPPVDRPNLSKDYLAGTVPEDWIPLRSPEFYAEAGIELIAGESVISLDRSQRTVTLSGGHNVGYGALLFATGAEPRRLSLPGADLPHVRYLRSFDDSRAIIAALDGATSAVVVGAGSLAWRWLPRSVSETSR